MRAAVILLCALSLSTPLLAADRPAPANPLAPFLVSDLNPVPSASGDAFFVEAERGPVNAVPVAMGRVLYFAAADPVHGRELWRSDGTATGTWRVSDVRPGPEGSDPRNLTVHEGRVFFTADDGAFGVEMWASDGTRAGTRLVADLCAGPCSSMPSRVMPRLMPSPGRLFFTAAKDGGQSTDLWSTDGTRAGTREVPGTRNVTQMAPLPNGGVVFNLASVPWRTDGTPEGTFKIQSPFFFSMNSLTGLDKGVVFWAGSSGDLWLADGTAAGLTTVRNNGPIPQTPPVVQDGAVYFATSVGFTNPQIEVWVARGAPLRTFRLGTFKPEPGLDVPQLTASPCGPLFLARNPEGELRIWRIASPTGPIQPVSGTLARAGDVQGLWSAADRAFFTLKEESGFGLWEVDGISCQARRVKDIGKPSLLAGAGGTGFFVTSTAAQGAELWRSDGTAAGTFLVKDIGFDPGSAAGSEIVALGGRVLFPARPVPTAPTALWTSSGTVAGTRPVHEVPWAQGLVRVGDAVFFSGGVLENTPGVPRDQTLIPRGVWRTDGTPAGTQLLAPDAHYFQGLGAAGNRLLFSAADSSYFARGLGFEPWISDGTTAGTRRMLDLNPFIITACCLQPDFPASSHPGPAVALGSSFLFAADDGVTGHEPWISDGTAAGTRRLLDINLQPDPDPETDGALTEGSTFGPFVPLGPLAFFAADDGIAGRELWATDGTTAGTRRVRDLAPGTAGSDPHDLVAFGGRVFFLANDGTGQALWSSDGTEAGTVRVAALAHQGRPSWGRSMIAAGTRLFFVVDNDALGPELWTSDGTAAGTQPVADLRPGPGGSYPQALTVVSGKLVFAADDGTTGLEPWMSDGTAAGTRRLGDIAPGPDGSSPLVFTAAGTKLFFSASDGQRGRELWAVSLARLRR